MDSIDYYNRYAVPYYEETVDASMEEVMKPFVELLSEESENAEVLDLGCGSGRDTLLLEEYGFYVTPMDGSEEMCKLAEVNTDKEVLQMTYDEMEFDDVFDGIWACASLIHLTEDEIFPMECFARKKHSSAIGFISASFAKYLQFDYDELENFVASILDTDGSSETDGYAYRGYRIFVEKL